MSLYGEYYGPADDRDLALAAERQHQRDALAGGFAGRIPLVGDVVVFPGGEQLRISHVWSDDADAPSGIQTSAGGSWHWCANGDMSFSGGLNSPIPAESLSADGTATVNAWIFHHDLMSAHRSVDVTAEVTVWSTSAALP